MSAPVRQSLPSNGSAVPWTGRNEAGLLGVRMFTRFSLLTGLWLGPVFLVVGTWFAIPFLSLRRRGSQDFFAHFHGRVRPWLLRVWDTYRQFLAWTLCWHERTIAFVRGPDSLRIDKIGSEHIALAREQGRGVILLTAHVGNFELGAWCFAQQFKGLDAPPVHLVMIDSEVDAVRNYLDALRGDFKPNIVAVNHSSFSALPVIHALKRGEVACMQGDRATGTRAMKLPFLGKEAPFPLGAYHLAKLTGAAVLPIICRRIGRAHYEFETFPALPTERPEQALAEYVRILERETRARPHYWFNLFSFWDGSHAPIEAVES